MKKHLLFLITVLMFTACAKKPVSTDGFFGAQFDPSTALGVEMVTGLIADKDSVQAMLTGKVIVACQVKGCWMTMDLGNGEEMQVRFKDYGFFVPKNSGGMTATIDGWAYRKVVPVEELRHYAEDEGQSEEEIASITEDEEQIVFIANGVMMK